ncbi:hypothetical protein V5T82_15590 [Magnetovibrio sp. PR-2]|uniref:hypothetical protein n=1 Tax=Magnetovibrio sp. PR-2 TaxID=3120356 RepID=UPI002FCDFB58
MNGKVIAVNHRLGAIVAETDAYEHVILEAHGRVEAEIGDELEADWTTLGKVVVQNLTKGGQMAVMLQITGISRNDAIARTTVV